MRRRKQNSLLLYLLLNVFVSAATILGVLWVWERVRQNQLPPTPEVTPAAQTATEAPTEAVLPDETATPTRPAGTLIQIAAVIGATDPQQEYVQLKRLGEGDLSLAGWQLQDEDGNAYTFSSSPELILYKGGAVQVYTRIGNDTPAEVFWNRAEAVWRPGEWATLVDDQGTVQATYQVP